jgi:hypothetical protein
VDDAQAQLEAFLAKYEPHIAAEALAAVKKLEARLPGATAMVYDNYNALAIGFEPTEKAGQAVLSIAVFPRHVTLCFLFGNGLPDPHGLLRGEGARVRHVRLQLDTIDDPRIATARKKKVTRVRRFWAASSAPEAAKTAIPR